MNRKTLLILCFSILVKAVWAYDWPLDADNNPENGLEFSKQHQVLGTFAEWTNSEYKKGIDIYAPKGAPVFAVETGNLTIIGDVAIIGKFWYGNLNDFAVTSGFIGKGTLIGYVNETNFLHFRESSTIIPSGGTGEWINPLRQPAGLNYTDTEPPLIKSVRLVKQNQENTSSTLFDSYDLIVDAYDAATMPDGTGNHAVKCGIDKIEIQFFDKDENQIKHPNGNTVVINNFSGFEELPECESNLVYAQGTSNHCFKYIATNAPFDENQVYDKYWNSRQKKGDNYDVSANIPSESLFHEGVIKIKIVVSDVAGNTVETWYSTKDLIALASITELNVSSEINGTLYWQTDQKSITKNKVWIGNTNTVALTPKLKVFTDLLPSGQIKLKAVNNSGVETIINATLNETDKTITLSSPNDLTVNLPSNFTTDDNYKIEWFIQYENSEWLKAGITELQITKLSEQTLDFHITNDAVISKFPCNTNAYFTKKFLRKIQIELTDKQGNKFSEVKWNGSNTTDDQYKHSISSVSSTNTGTGITAQIGSFTTKINIVTIEFELEELTYSGTNSLWNVYKDNGTLCNAPHWTTSEEKPVCFVRNTKPENKAKFKVTPSIECSQKIWLQGNSANYGIQKNQITIPGSSGSFVSEFETPVLSPQNNLPNTIDLISSHKIGWQVSTDEQNWFDAGESENKIYVIYAAPVANKLYETLLDIACRNAKGQDQTNLIVDKIWEDFSSPTPSYPTSPSVKRVDGKAMKYWLNHQLGVNPPQNLAGMLADADGNGSCIAWSQLFHETLDAVGIAGSQVFELRFDKTIINNPNLNLSNKPEDYAFLVKDWTYTGNGSLSSLLLPFQYEMNVDCFAALGVPGQQNPDPPDAFINHYVF